MYSLVSNYIIFQSQNTETLNFCLQTTLQHIDEVAIIVDGSLLVHGINLSDRTYRPGDHLGLYANLSGPLGLANTG